MFKQRIRKNPSLDQQIKQLKRELKDYQDWNRAMADSLKESTGLAFPLIPVPEGEESVEALTQAVDDAKATNHRLLRALQKNRDLQNQFYPEFKRIAQELSLWLNDNQGTQVKEVKDVFQVYHRFNKVAQACILKLAAIVKQARPEGLSPNELYTYHLTLYVLYLRRMQQDPEIPGWELSACLINGLHLILTDDFILTQAQVNNKDEDIHWVISKYFHLKDQKESDYADFYPIFHSPGCTLTDLQKLVVLVETCVNKTPRETNKWFSLKAILAYLKGPDHIYLPGVREEFDKQLVNHSYKEWAKVAYNTLPKLFAMKVTDKNITIFHTQLRNVLLGDGQAFGLIDLAHKSNQGPAKDLEHYFNFLTRIEKENKTKASVFEVNDTLSCQLSIVLHVYQSTDPAAIIGEFVARLANNPHYVDEPLFDRFINNGGSYSHAEAFQLVISLYLKRLADRPYPKEYKSLQAKRLSELGLLNTFLLGVIRDKLDLVKEVIPEILGPGSASSSTRLPYRLLSQTNTANAQASTNNNNAQPTAAKNK